LAIPAPGLFTLAESCTLNRGSTNSCSELMPPLEKSGGL